MESNMVTREDMDCQQSRICPGRALICPCRRERTENQIFFRKGRIRAGEVDDEEKD